MTLDRSRLEGDAVRPDDAPRPTVDDGAGITPDGPLDALKPEFLRIAAEVGLARALAEDFWTRGTRDEALTKYGWQPAAIRTMLTLCRDSGGDLPLVSYADFCVRP